MEVNKGLLEKAKAAKSAEELAEMAKAEGVELTAEEAEKAFENLHQSGELADDELDNVAGGSCDGNPSPSGEVDSKDKVVFLYEVGQRVEWIDGPCGQTTRSVIVGRYIEEVDSGRYIPRYKVKMLDTTAKFADKEYTIRQDNIQIP